MQPLLQLDDLDVSWAQHGEDMLLRRAFASQPTGFFIDIGANHPLVDSVTKYFSLRGWRGVNVEPLPALHRLLVEDRPRDINLNAAVSDSDGFLELDEVQGAPGLSTANATLADALRAQGRHLLRHRVPCLTLTALCEAHCRDVTIDFLKVDVEGHEERVLRGGDFQRFRPRVLLIEAGAGSRGWHELVLSWGYRFALEDGLNHAYVREEDEALVPLLAAPPRVTERFIRADLARSVRQGREWAALGPAVQAVARRLAQAKDANPQLKAALKTLWGRLAPGR